MTNRINWVLSAAENTVNQKLKLERNKNSHNPNQPYTRNTQSTLSRLQEIQIFSGYAEPGYDGNLVAVGNWNDCGDGIISRTVSLLEKLDCQLEWSDEWTSCDHCGLLVRTSPNSYGWKPSYVFDKNQSEIVCLNCLDAEDHLLSLEGKDSSANTFDHINPANYGYVKLEDYQHGFHLGQDDNPEVIGKELKERGVERYLFNLDSNEQFCQNFSVWVHQSEC